MTIHWKKRGLAITPNEDLWWMKTHAMLPTPDHIGDGIYRIYFAGRNGHNQSHIGYAVIDMAEPEKVLDYSKDPILSPGRLGTFDDNGVLPSCLLRQSETEQLLYIIGFKPGGTTRMDLFGGLTTSQDGGRSFSRWSEAPIIGRNRVNPFINTAPWVICDEDHYKMYYVSGIEWVHVDLPRYNIQIATSICGKEWSREGQVAIDFEEGENALARPYVVKDKGRYKMWFSSKGDYYLPRYAESDDGITWYRSDEMSKLVPSKGGPDEEMICYPIVLEHKGQKIAYYNGNGYGLNGICLAVEE
ncbi:hypothetical protein [Kiloniella majae]|uniref:hypothetical protein n=1 Tax=Kiloniella majae TaxID=1938558 RepID=UPI000A278A04|nr:hypothetical protein [Kiloniella majae]